MDEVSTSQPSDFFFFVAVVLVLGGAFVLVGRMTRRRTERLRRVGRKTSAEVVAHKHRRDRDGDLVAYPVVRFRAPDGRLVTAEGDVGGSWTPGIGEHVEVLFDPSRPEEIHIDNPSADKVVRLFEVLGWVMLGGACVGAVVTTLIVWQ